MKIYSKNQSLLLDIEVDDNSYRQRAIMGDHNVTLYFSTVEHVEIPVGSYIEYQGDTYTLERPEALKMKHSRYFEYTVTFESAQAKAKVWKFRNTVDGRLKFPLTAKPHEHLQMFVDNMNRRDTGWTVGECIEGTETLISYDHAYCLDALSQIATTFKTEYEFSGKQVSLRKVEYFKTNPLSLSYGRGNGFKTGVGRSNYGDMPPIEILYAQGGSDNIDNSKYGASELLLPKNQTIRYDGVHFEDEAGFNAAQARHYIVDGDGLSIRRGDKSLETLVEDSIDCSEYYPKRVGTISSVVCVDEEKHFWDIVDNDIPEQLNYEDYLLEGETMTVTFQTGMLAGKTFDVKYYHNSVTDKQGKVSDARRFEIVPVDIDGITMPDRPTGYYPKPGDTYAVFNCFLPDVYICDNYTKTGAEWDMFRACVKYLFDNEDTRFSFTGQVDGIWAKKNWTDIGGKIVIGGFVRFTDNRFQKEPVLVRITTVKDYINSPHSPEIELSNSTVTSGVSSQLKQLQSEEVIRNEHHNQSVQYTKRSFRDAKETMKMLYDALLDNFTESISPISVQTMQMLVGDESLQFIFVRSLTDRTQIADTIQYDQATKQLKIGASVIQHMTLGISSISSEHKTDEYMVWSLPAYTSAFLSDGTIKYYLYAKVSATGQTGEFTMSTQAHKMKETSGYYWLLCGILNSEADGERSFAPLFGFTEILPSRVITDRVVSGNGQSFFDMLNNAMKLGDALQFNINGVGLLKLRGTLVQSQSGAEAPVGCFRGVWNIEYTYYNGDEVVYDVNGCTSQYRYINGTPTKGHAPTEITYWQVCAQGSQGEAGKYTELRYAVNGSTIIAPLLNKKATNPFGWSTIVPEVSISEYLWMTTCEKSGTGVKLTDWSEPVRISPYDGHDGQDGEPGKSPAMVYRGLYDSQKTYYGNENRLDCVKYGDAYYIARIDAGTFSDIVPTDNTKWNAFGASFESVATQLLLAEEANIAGWIFRNNRLESQNEAAYLDGVNGTMRLKGTLQLSTGISGNYSDVNLFYLPAVNAETEISMGTQQEDLGKVIRLYNSGDFGNKSYKINAQKWNVVNGKKYVISHLYFELRPQEVIEMTCYATSEIAGNNYSAYWTMTSRLTQQDFRNGDNKGRYPLCLAMGYAVYKQTYFIISGTFWNGKLLQAVFRVERIDVGNYKLHFSTEDVPDGSFFLVQGYQTQVIDARLGTIYWNGSNSYVEVFLSDDNSLNDGSFSFMVFAPYWNYELT